MSEAIPMGPGAPAAPMTPSPVPEMAVYAHPGHEIVQDAPIDPTAIRVATSRDITAAETVGVPEAVVAEPVVTAPRNGNFISRHPRRAVAVGALAGLAAVASIFGVAGNKSGANGGQASAAPSASSAGLTPSQLTVGEFNQLKADLTVNEIPASADCVDIAQTTAFDKVINLGTTNKPNYAIAPMIGAEANITANGGNRLWNDSMEGPLTNPADAAGSLKEIEATICEDPLYGVTLANMFANMEVDGVQVVNINEWLKPYDFDASQTPNDIAADANNFFPTKNADGSETETPASNAEYQAFAEKLVTLLQKFQNTGESTQQTVLNYHLSGLGLVAGEMPEVSLNPDQYDANAIWLKLTKKTGGCFVEIGFNVGDQRPEEANDCVTPVTPTTVPMPKAITPNHPSHPTSTTVPRHGVTTTTVHGTTTTQPAVTTTTQGSTTTTTTKIGPKPTPTQGPGGAPTTSTPPDQESGPTPTTSTTTPTTLPTTETTVTAPVTETTTPPGSGTQLP